MDRLAKRAELLAKAGYLELSAGVRRFIL